MSVRFQVLARVRTPAVILEFDNIYITSIHIIMSSIVLLVVFWTWECNVYGGFAGSGTWGWSRFGRVAPVWTGGDGWVRVWAGGRRIASS